MPIILGSLWLPPSQSHWCCRGTSRGRWTETLFHFYWWTSTLLHDHGTSYAYAGTALPFPLSHSLTCGTPGLESFLSWISTSTFLNADPEGGGGPTASPVTSSSSLTPPSGTGAAKTKKENPSLSWKQAILRHFSHIWHSQDIGGGKQTKKKQPEYLLPPQPQAPSCFSSSSSFSLWPVEPQAEFSSCPSNALALCVALPSTRRSKTRSDSDVAQMFTMYSKNRPTVLSITIHVLSAPDIPHQTTWCI